MADSFQLKALRLIRTNVPLPYPEFEMLQYLIGCAEHKCFWDAMGRLKDEHCYLVMNIIARSQFAGLEPLLIKLKQEMEQEQESENAQLSDV